MTSPEQEAWIARKREFARALFARKHLREYLAAIDYNALNEHYGFHGGPCPATSSSVTPTSPPTT